CRVAAEDLVEQRQLQLAEPGPAELLVEEQRPEAARFDLVLQLLDLSLDGRVVGADGIGEDEIERRDLLLAEPLHPVELLLELRLRREVPRHPPRLSPAADPVPTADAVSAGKHAIAC